MAQPLAVNDTAPPVQSLPHNVEAEAALLGAYLEVDEARFGVEEIRYLYDSAAFPLKRTAARRSVSEATA